MAFTEEPVKISVALKLNNGTTSTGAIRTVSVNIGKLDIEGYDVNKVGAMANALAPCLDRNLYALQKTTTSDLAED